MAVADPRGSRAEVVRAMLGPRPVSLDHCSEGWQGFSEGGAFPWGRGVHWREPPACLKVLCNTASITNPVDKELSIGPNREP
eukprot:12530066-Heterocapsa_arctica.AAC.1